MADSGHTMSPRCYPPIATEEAARVSQVLPRV
jgi:hypothetical protein